MVFRVKVIDLRSSEIVTQFLSAGGGYTGEATSRVRQDTSGSLSTIEPGACRCAARPRHDEAAVAAAPISRAILRSLVTASKMIEVFGSISKKQKGQPIVT
jgi:hypothetical protein